MTSTLTVSIIVVATLRAVPMKPEQNLWAEECTNPEESSPLLAYMKAGGRPLTRTHFLLLDLGEVPESLPPEYVFPDRLERDVRVDHSGRLVGALAGSTARHSGWPID